MSLRRCRPITEQFRKLEDALTGLGPTQSLELPQPHAELYINPAGAVVPDYVYLFLRYIYIFFFFLVMFLSWGMWTDTVTVVKPPLLSLLQLCSVSAFGQTVNLEFCEYPVLFLSWSTPVILKSFWRHEPNVTLYRFKLRSWVYIYFCEICNYKCPDLLKAKGIDFR